MKTGEEGLFDLLLVKGDVVQKGTVQVGPQIYKGTPADTAKSQGWTLFAPATTPEGKDQVVQLPAVISIESGLTVNDRVVVNGLTKARPGSPVAPLAFELKLPTPAGTK